MSILSLLGKTGKIEFVGNLFHKRPLKTMLTKTKTKTKTLYMFSCTKHELTPFQKVPAMIVRKSVSIIITIFLKNLR